MPKRRPIKKKRTIKKMRGGATINYLNNMVDDLDLFIYLIQFLTHQEIIRLYDSDEIKYTSLVSQIMLRYPNFKLKFNYSVNIADSIKLQQMGFTLDLEPNVDWRKRENNLPFQLYYDPQNHPSDSDSSDY